MTTQPTRVALVTGATGTIGQAIARQLAEQPAFEVILAARNEKKAAQAVDKIKRVTGNAQVRYELVDVARPASIQALAERWQGPLHVLINNAGITPPSRQETPEGVELQFAINVLGYLRIIEAFAAVLQASAPARIINVASSMAWGLALDDLEFKRRRYDNSQAYAQAKQANRMLTVAYAERLQPAGITVNACHPGDVSSTLSNSLGFGGSMTPAEGAETPVWLATAPRGGQVTGKYFVNRQEQPDRFAEDRAAVARLAEICQGYLGAA